ncbi:MAG: hypothetical protein JWO38_925 [Gemmataceae bacterium]|nr:hypothetical protein [Gemmataceae bacterium]
MTNKRLIRFVCPNPDCRKSYKSPPEKSGKRTVCTACRWKFTIPTSPSLEPPPRAALSQIDEAERGAGGSRSSSHSALAEEVDQANSTRTVPDASMPSPTSQSSCSSTPPSHPPGPPVPISPPLFDCAPARPPEPPVSGPGSGPRPLWRDPLRLGLAVAGFCAFWVIVLSISLMICVSRGSPSSTLIGIVAASVVLASASAYFAAHLGVAKHRAITGHPVTLFFGLARLVTWEQNEGLIFLRDKRIAEQIYGPISGGGLRIIYPLLGEELRGRVPLTLQLTWFRDERVLTRESVQLTIKVALWWQVCDLQRYFYQIDSEVHAIRDTGMIPAAGVATAASPTPRGHLGIAEIWVQTLAETCLRTLISGTSTFLIVSKRAASCLHVEDDAGGRPKTDDPTPATPDVIAGKLKAELEPRLTDYGMGVDRVEIQEVQLPPKIQEAVDAVWIASTHPAKSKFEAEAQRNRLQVLCDLLGREAVGVSEIMKALPDGALVGNPLASIQSLFLSLGGLSTGSSGSIPPTGGSPPAPAPKDHSHPSLPGST